MRSPIGVCTAVMLASSHGGMAACTALCLAESAPNQIRFATTSSAADGTRQSQDVTTPRSQS